MSILAWFRGLFDTPKKKRQAVVNQMIYATYLQDPNAKVYVNGIKFEQRMPDPGPLTEQNARRLIEIWPNVNVKQIARKLNQMGYLTPRGKKWRENTVRYWRQSEQTLSKRRAYWKQYDKTRRQPQTVIFRNADLRPRQNGVN